ncbi:MAG: ATP-dependent DNA ligase, partial [archaeon]
MRFSKVAESFASIESVSSRLEMTSRLKELLEASPKDDIRQLVYLLQGTIGPSYSQLDFGLGEKLVIEAIAKAYGYQKEDVEKSFREKGDLGECAEEFAAAKKQKSLFSEELSVKKVFENLNKIAKAEGSGSQELKMKLLAELLNSASASEAKYVVRITLENLRLGIGDPTIMDALALVYLEEYKKENPEALKNTRESLKEKRAEKRVEELERKMKQELREAIEEKYNIHSDLGGIAFKLKEEGLKGLEKIEMQPGIPFRPTAAERLPSAEEIIKKLGKCAVEAKYDGFRLQVHKNGSEVQIFSRHAEPMTEMFPEIVAGIIGQVNAKTAILEGEALSYNEQTGEFYPFQVTIQRKRKYEIKKMSDEF